MHCHDYPGTNCMAEVIVNEIFVRGDRLCGEAAQAGADIIRIPDSGFHDTGQGVKKIRNQESGIWNLARPAGAVESP